MPNKAFTLIELLIVVAIIAILAAIAVPNFLEAQVRAKVSRAKSDMRSIATALESYAVDYNKYPRDADDYPDYNPMGATFGRWYQKDFYAILTTPIAYITSTPMDPFHTSAMNFEGKSAQMVGFMQVLFAGDPPHPYAYITDGENEAAFGDTNPIQANNNGHPSSYGITSLGPNRFFDSAEWNPTASREENEANSAYDPTNGTLSRGDIVRKGPGNPEHD